MKYLNSEYLLRTINYYTIAGSVYESCFVLDELLLSTHKKSATKFFSLNLPEDDLNTESTTYNDKAFIGVKEYDLHVKIMRNGSYKLQNDEEKYSINDNIVNIHQIKVDKEILLGPVLILNLALNNIFCLHSSSFILNNKAFIFMGDSGTGKSTVANYINNQENCLRLSDDILPLTISNKNLMLLPHFPQLKLPIDEQYQGKDLEIETILLFAKQSNDNTDIKPIDRFTANKKLIQHSVATKLFARKELKNHLSFCHETCSLTRSYQLNYQHSPNSLEKLFSLLNEIN